jgi:ABC-type bacteriocin/lantibiotic exporter with double-glycine peptidase domain
MSVEWYALRRSRTGVLPQILSQIRLVMRLERKVLALIGVYAWAMGVLFLGIPMAVQELVSTFSFAVEPVMIVTLGGVILVIWCFIAAFRVLQARAVEILLQRLYTRLALSFTAVIPRLRTESFAPQQANVFMEAELMTRALVAMIADLMNVIVVGAVGMTMLVFFHPYFLAYDLVLVCGFVALLTILGRGGFLITWEVSKLNYAVFNWIQNIAANLPHIQAMAGSPFLMKRTDELTNLYVAARKVRSDFLTGRQYKSAALWQAVGHSGLIVTAGLLVAEGQLTVGQFAAAEVIVGNLLLNMDTLARRMYALFYVFASFRHMAELFQTPREQHDGRDVVPLNAEAFGGIRVSCRQVSYGYPDEALLVDGVDVEVAPGEKVLLLCRNSTAKTALAKVLAGLYVPTSGVVRYNNANLVDVGLDRLTAGRGLVLDSHPSLLEATLEENISLGRPTVSYEDIQWALRFVELDDDIDRLPDGLRTRVVGDGRAFTTSQILRILVARAIVGRPHLLIFDGTLHNMVPQLREVILRRLCSKEEPWSVLFVSNDHTVGQFVDRQMVVN